MHGTESYRKQDMTYIYIYFANIGTLANTHTHSYTYMHAHTHTCMLAYTHTHTLQTNQITWFSILELDFLHSCKLSTISHDLTVSPLHGIKQHINPVRTSAFTYPDTHTTSCTPPHPQPPPTAHQLLTQPQGMHMTTWCSEQFVCSTATSFPAEQHRELASDAGGWQGLSAAGVCPSPLRPSSVAWEAPEVLFGDAGSDLPAVKNNSEIVV